MTDQTQTTTEPVAWMYDLATVHDRAFHTYDGWKACLSRSKPDVPGGGIRNIVPLYTTPQPLAVGLDREAVFERVRHAVFLGFEHGTCEGEWEPDYAKDVADKEADKILALSAPADVGGEPFCTFCGDPCECGWRDAEMATRTPPPAPVDHIGDATEKVDWAVVGPKLVEALEKARDHYDMMTRLANAGTVYEVNRETGKRIRRKLSEVIATEADAGSKHCRAALAAAQPEGK